MEVVGLWRSLEAPDVEESKLPSYTGYTGYTGYIGSCKPVEDDAGVGAEGLDVSAELAEIELGGEVMFPRGKVSFDSTGV